METVAFFVESMSLSCFERVVLHAVVKTIWDDDGSSAFIVNGRTLEVEKKATDGHITGVYVQGEGKTSS
eukprot:13989984-Ditylum_brightwellii.AAC.1